MNEYMNKPFVPADLFRELRRFLLKKEEVTGENNQHFIYTESKKLYSLNHLIELDDLDCLCEVLQIFLESTPVLMNEIKEAIVSKNWEETYKRSHKLKSSIGILQMGKLMSLISKIESDAKERKNLEEIPVNFEKAQKLLLQIIPMIKDELENALELVCRRLVNGKPPVFKVGHLNKGVRALHNVGQNLAVRQPLGNATLERFVEFAQDSLGKNLSRCL